MVDFSASYVRLPEGSCVQSGIDLRCFRMFFFCSFWYGMKSRGDTSSEMIMKFQDDGWFSIKTSGEPAVDRPYSNDCTVLYERLPFLRNQYAHIRFEILRSNFSPQNKTIRVHFQGSCTQITHGSIADLSSFLNGKPYVLYGFVIRNSWYLEIWWNLSSFRKEVLGTFLGIRYISDSFTEIGRNKTTPQAVRVLAVACGENSTVALMSSGELYSWGTLAEPTSRNGNMMRLVSILWDCHVVELS